MTREENNKWLSWGVIILALLFCAPVGAVLLLWKLYTKDRDARESREAGYFQTDAAPEERDLHQARNRDRVDTRINQPRASAAGPSKPPRKRGSPNPKKGLKRMIFGAIWAFLGAMPAASGWSLNDLTLFLIPGLIIFLWGFLLNRSMRRCAGNLKRIGQRDTISREELAAMAGCSPRQAERDLRKMTEEGYLGENAYYNDAYERMFLNVEAEEAWKQAEQARQEKEEEAAAVPREAEEGYSGILRSIRRANEKIADPALSAKVEELQSITARIFRAAEEDPQKAKRIDTFLNYYLPTTQKLLDSYVQFESAGVEGENLSQAKARIASTMDMIIKGFSHQLDALYKADAMDVDTDIRVMESMLRRDTASAAEDFGLSGGTSRRSSVAEDFGLGRASGQESAASPAPGGSQTGSKTGGYVPGTSFEEDFGMGGAAVQKEPE